MFRVEKQKQKLNSFSLFKTPFYALAPAAPSPSTTKALFPTTASAPLFFLPPLGGAFTFRCLFAIRSLLASASLAASSATPAFLRAALPAASSQSIAARLGSPEACTPAQFSKTWTKDSTLPFGKTQEHKDLKTAGSALLAASSLAAPTTRPWTLNPSFSFAPASFLISSCAGWRSSPSETIRMSELAQARSVRRSRHFEMGVLKSEPPLKTFSRKPRRRSTLAAS